MPGGGPSGRTSGQPLSGRADSEAGNHYHPFCGLHAADFFGGSRSGRLRHVEAGAVRDGEALSLELKERFFSKFNCELHNLYGPTETSVEVSWWACRSDDGLRAVPI